jgi:hypothetical protein
VPVRVSGSKDDWRRSWEEIERCLWKCLRLRDIKARERCLTKSERKMERAVIDNLISILSGTRPWQSSLRVRVGVVCRATPWARHEKVQARLGGKRGGGGERRSRRHRHSRGLGFPCFVGGGEGRIGKTQREWLAANVIALVRELDNCGTQWKTGSELNPIKGEKNLSKDRLNCSVEIKSSLSLSGLNSRYNTRLQQPSLIQYLQKPFLWLFPSLLHPINQSHFILSEFGRRLLDQFIFIC